MTILEFYEEFNSRFDKKMQKHLKQLDQEFMGRAKWTEFMEDLIRNIFEDEKFNYKFNCISKYKIKELPKDQIKEFLDIDFTVFTSFPGILDINCISKWIMEYAIEHENSTNPDRMGYNISKLLNTKAKNKVFIGYTSTEESKDEIFNQIIEQIKKIKPSHFNKNEKLLIMLGHEWMGRTRDYKSKLIYLNSKNIDEL